jgi:sugar lactone lactonase YvrE
MAAEPRRTRRRRAVPLVVAALVVAVTAGAIRAGHAAGAPLDIEAFYPEGPTADGPDILWAEMSADRVRRLHDGVVSTAWQRPGCGPTMVKRTATGDYWVLCHLDHRVLRLSRAFATVLDLASDESGRRILYPNDGVVDERGRLFFSSSGPFSLDVPPSGYLMSVDERGHVARLTGPLRYPNGVTIDRAGRRLLVSEHLNRRILSLPLEGLHPPAMPRVFFDFAKQGVPPAEYPLAGPDGLLVTPEGQVVVAEYGAGRIHFISREGRLLRTLPVPMPFVTNLLVHPTEPHTLVVVGAFDNTRPPLPGRVISVPLPALP